MGRGRDSPGIFLSLLIIHLRKKVGLGFMKFRGEGGTHLGAAGVQGRSPAWTDLLNFTSKFMDPL